ncbi:MAG: monovalent cation/H(+) antiporter subunit G [Caldilineaceae bacterium]|nr:monovalent cation/H(+) antiporter subunit G [Caldilineaceae bacterium]
MTPQELGILTLASIGVFFMLVSSIGLVRLPDVYARMQSAGKATTLGIGFTLLAAGFYYGEWGLFRMIVLLVLFFITGPIATTAMAHAAYRTDYEREIVLHYDELADAEADQQLDGQVAGNETPLNHISDAQA